MRDRLLKILGIEAGEESMVSMLLTQSVFLGIFFGAFDISAHSLFLSIFDEKMMARGYVLSGIAGIILTAAYTRLQTRMVFRNFATLNLIFVASLTLVLWIILLLNPAHWVVFLVFIMLGPLNILAMLGFWGTTGRLFTLRQGKRLFGLVDAGLIIGIIVSCYSIPVLLSLGFNSHNILLVSAAAALLGSFIQVLIGSKFLKRVPGRDNSEKANSEKPSLFNSFLNDPYIRIMAVFITLSVMTAFFIQYSFMAVTRSQYPAEEDMARFLGLFTGSMMIFTLLVKLFVFSYLIKNYGLKICLTLSPLLVAAFTLIAFLIGLLMGYTPAAEGIGPMLFFMLLALGRLFSKALKDSIESPSFKVIYQTIDENRRYEVQSGMDGTVNEISALSSGLILAGLGILSFVKLIHFSLVLIVITILWVYFAAKLYREYRNSIRKALGAGKDNPEEVIIADDRNEIKSRFSAGVVFRREYFNLISGNMTPLSKAGSRLLCEAVVREADSTNDLALIPALKHIASAGGYAENKELATSVLGRLNSIQSGNGVSDDRLMISRALLAGSRQPQTTQILRLLRDISPESRKLALMMIGKFRFKEMLPEVCEALDSPALEQQAESVIKSFGRDSDEYLIRRYMASSGNIRTCRTILRLISNNASPATESFLFTRLWSTNRVLREESLNRLLEKKFRCSGEEMDKILQLISDIAGVLTWNIAARIAIVRGNATHLKEDIDLEISRWTTFLFNTLSITYDPSSVDRIRENLENGTVESVNFALEMIDIVVDESIKPKLIPLLDVIPDEEKIKNLYQFFPADIPEYNQLIEDILNRDYNLTGIRIRATAMRNQNGALTMNMEESLVAALFSPEAIIREEAAALLARTAPDSYSAASSRLAPDVRERLNKIAGDMIDKAELSFEKLLFIVNEFPDMTEEQLLFLSGELKYEAINQTDTSDYINLGSSNRKLDYLLRLSSASEFCQLFPTQAERMMKFVDNKLLKMAVGL